MKIKKISKIKKTGILQDLNWSKLPSDSKFKSINLIFGWNGTGKTTLSRVLRNFELGKICKKLEKYPNSEYEINLASGSKLSHRNLGPKNNLRVFNKDFVEENIFQDIEQDGNRVKAIIYLGGKKIELAKERKEKEKDKEELEAVVEEDLHKLERERENFEASVAKEIKDTLLGIKKFQHYDRGDFVTSFQLIQEKIEKGGKTLPELIIEDALFDTNLKSVKDSQTVSSWIIKIKDSAGNISATYLEDIDNILKKTASLKETIDKLKSDWELSSWVQKGLSIHKNRKSTHCEFCNQSLPTNKIKDLEAHFNKDYTNVVNAIAKNIESLNSWKIQDIEIIPNEELKKLARKLNGVFEELISELKNKQKKIFSSVSLRRKRKEILEEIKVILDNSDKIGRSLTELAEDLESSLIASKFEEYTEKLEKVRELTGIEATLNVVIKDLDKKITENEKDTDDYELPAEEINKDLENFLGHSELKFKATKDVYGDVYYEIKRGEEIASNLSEGEKNAISLVYFLRKLKEREFGMGKGVVFIDDPVSSLDSQFLYSAYSFILSAIEKDSNHELKVGQFFLSTHNYDFFNLFKRTYRGDRCSLYMLRVNLDKSKNRVANIYELDPLLKNFDSDYQYLFSKLIDFEDASESERNDLELVYQYPNIARRVLETFLSFKFPSKQHYREKVDAAQKVGKAIRESVYRFTNVQSHGTIREAVGFTPETIEPTAKDQILNVLEIMREEDSLHCEEMEKVIRKRKR